MTRSQDPAIHGGCPAPERLAAYVDGQSEGAERALVEQHLSTCGRCFGTFAETLRFRQADPAWRPQVLSRGGSFSRAVALAAGVVGVASLVGILGWLAWSSRGRRTEVAALVDAVGDRRVVEPRLTGGFAYGPVPPLTRSAERPGGGAPLELAAAAASIEKAALERPTARTIGALGLAHLVLGDTAKAVSLLEEAADKAPDDPHLSADLAAAYLVRARREERPDDVPKALAAAERALRQDPRLSEARFNKALALEGLALPSQAEEAWHAYLELDPHSGWADEARRHLEALRGSRRSESWEEVRGRLLAAADRGDPLLTWVRCFPRETREYLEDDLFAGWASAEAASADSAPAMRQARALADALLVATGDPLDKEAAAALQVTARPGAAFRSRRRSLIEGHQAFGEGRALYLRDDFAGASRSLRRAQKLLERGGSPLARWAGLYLIRAAYFPNDRPGALGGLSALDDVARQHGYHALRSRTLWMRGLIRESRSELTRALQDYETALACFRRLGEDDGAIQIHLMMASSFDSLGDASAGWVQRLAALRLIGPGSTARRSMSAFTDGTRAALRQEMPGVAVHFERALLQVAERWGNPAALAEAHVQQALIDHEVAGEEAGLAHLADARRSQREIADKSLAGLVASEVSLAAGVLLARRRPEEAVAALTDAIEYLRVGGESQRLPLAYLLRGRALLLLGKEEGAERDFEEGIRVFEDRRLRQGQEGARISFFARASELFEEEIRLQARRRDPERALAFAERQRARELLDGAAQMRSATHAEGGVPPLSPEEIRTLLPEGLALVYYSALPDRLLAWVVTRGGVRLAETRVDLDLLKRRTAMSRAAVARRGPMSDAVEAGGSLYDVLLRPVADALPPGATLVFVPDAALQEVPFAALLDRRTGRFLVQDHPIGVAPSGSMLVRTRARLAELYARNRPLRALAVGNPRFDRVLFPGLDPLPGAEAEASDVARLYGESTVLVGPAATKARFLEEASRREVVHYAGHALPPPAVKGPLRLLFAHDPRDAEDGVLTPDELTRVAFARTRLVVLAACGSSSGPTVPGEGRLSLGRTLLASGVPSVVASLWNVDDAASHRLFVAFHRAFALVPDAAGALRAAQRALLEDPDPDLRHPSAWAGFEAMGAAVPAPHPEGDAHATVIP